MNSIPHSIFGHNLIFINNPNIKDFISLRSIDNIKFIKIDDFDIAQFGRVYEWSKLSSKYARVAMSRDAFSIEGDSRWALEVRDKLKIAWSGEGNIVYYSYSCHVDELLFWIFHTFLPLSLDYNKKMTIFHASGVYIGGKSVIFLAPTHGGKSTLANEFIKRGYSLVGDDSLGVIYKNDTIYTLSSYPFRRPYRRVGELGIYTESYISRLQELGRVYLLDRCNPKDNIDISKVRGLEAFEYLSKSLFVSYSRLSKEKMSLISAIIKNIPVYRLMIPWSIDRIDEVIEVIL